jgi:hypothetical protein
MADNKDIAFKLNIDGVEQSIKSVKDLKGAIKALQDEAESADIGSENYKNAIENIELLNEKLKEVTQTEKQAAKATEDMAKAEQEAAKETGDLRKQFEVLEDKLFLLAGQGKQNTDEFRALANEAAGLNKQIEQVNQSLEGGAATKSAEGFQMLSGGLTSVKDGLLELDFGKVKDGLMQAKQGFVMFGQGAKTALQGVKGALIATGIGALVVLLGTIIAYWDDIKGAIDGVSSEQKKLNAAAAENLAIEQDKLKSLESSNNTLKLQGLSEKEILALKIKQLDAVYEAQEAQLLSTIQTQQAQEAAEKRNKEILQGLISMTTAPLSLVLGAIDMAGKALGKNFGLSEKLKGSITDLALGDEKENEEKRKKELDAQVQLLKDLKEKRAGFQLGINKIDDDAAKAAIEKQTKANEEAKAARLKEAEEYKAYLDKRNEDYLKSQQDELADLKKRLLDEDLLKQQQRENELSLDEAKRAKKFNDRLLDAELNSLNNKEDVDAQIALLEAKRQIELQNLELTQTERAIINKKYADQEDALLEASAEKKKADETAAVNGSLQLATQSLAATQQLTDLFFEYKKKGLQKGSKEEIKAAEQQFKVNKALQIANAVVSGIQGVMAAYSSGSAIPIIGAVAGPAFAILAGISAAANIAKIASAKFNPGTTSAPSSVGATGGAAPAIPAPPIISTQQNNTNQSTSFDETGKRIGGENEKQMQPTIQVKATVGVDEVSSKTNRVETLEKQSTF